MAPNLETYYLALLGNPEEGNLDELEKKFQRASAEYMVTRTADRVDISLIQKSGELTSAYLYLKAKWELKAKHEPFVPRILRIEKEKVKPLNKLELIYKELHRVASSGLLIAGFIGIYQLLYFAFGEPVTSVGVSDKTLEKLLIEEGQVRAMKDQHLNMKKLEHNKEFVAKLQTQEGTLIHNYAKGCNIPKLKESIERGQNLNRIDGEGQTPLHWTARINCVKGSELLIKAGARKDIVDKSGNTPLDWAKQSNNFESIQILQKKFR
jgi:hypothetical protein